MLKRWIRDFLETSNIKEQIALIEQSGLFNKDYYLKTYPDVTEDRIHPIAHYIRQGAAEGRNPSADFDTLWYLSENSELVPRGINPLVHYIRWGRTYKCRTAPLSDLQRFESFDRAIRSGRLDGTNFYYDIQGVSYEWPVGPACGAPPAVSNGLPLPPVQLSSRIGCETLEEFEATGQEVKATLMRCLPDMSFENARVLDFGCGVGRILRHFGDEAQKGEVWGCDIDATSILWCMDCLSPPFRFVQLADAPTLPFESSSFDLVYSVAVFSQLFRDWQVWAMEIRRILKPGGVFIMTFNGQHPYEAFFTDGRSYADLTRDTGMYVHGPYNPWNKGGPHVILGYEFVRKAWGSMFDIDFIAAEGLSGLQSICVMRKPAPGSPPRPGGELLALGTTQGYNPDAIGRISLRFDAAKPFRESYGIQAATAFDLEGWIAFRDDIPSDVAVFVDGRRIPSSATLAVDRKHDKWSADRYVFKAMCDASGFASGSHQLEVLVSGQAGTSHRMSVPLLLA